MLVKAAPGRAFCAGGDITGRDRAGAGAGRGRSDAVLPRGVPAQLAHPHLSQALSRPSRWHHHGRRGRHLGAWWLSDRHREHAVRDARDRDRLLPRCRLDLVPAALPRRRRHVSRADRGAAERRRLSGGGYRHACRAGGPSRRSRGDAGRRQLRPDNASEPAARRAWPSLAGLRGVGRLAGAAPVDRCLLRRRQHGGDRQQARGGGERLRGRAAGGPGHEVAAGGPAHLRAAAPRAGALDRGIAAARISDGAPAAGRA